MFSFKRFRNEWIRTTDLLFPKQALYQAELHSDLCLNIIKLELCNERIDFLKANVEAGRAKIAQHPIQ
jgi:hypothetical protein